VNAAPSAKPDENLNTTKLDAEPNVGFYIYSTSVANKQTALVDPTSCEGERDAVEILAGMAKKAGWRFEKLGEISAKVCDRTYNGSTLDQMEQVVKEAKIININIDLGVVRIWQSDKPKEDKTKEDKTKDGKPKKEEKIIHVHEISPENGLIGYPTLIQKTTKADAKTGTKKDGETVTTTVITCAMQLRPEILSGHIARVTDSSLITAAHGRWKITKVTHTFESENPNGKWFTEISGNLEDSESDASKSPSENKEQNDYKALLFVIQQLIKKIQTTTLVKVIAVRNSGGLAPVGSVDVQPLVNILDAAGNGHARGVLHNLPYLRIQGGKNAVIIDPEVGDIGMAGFCSRDISTVKRTRERSNPGSWATHSESDGLYLGGFLNGLPTQYVRFSGEGVELHSPTAITLSAPKVTIDTPTMNITGNVNVAGNMGVAGDLTNKDINVGSTHVHSGVQTGSYNTGAPH